MAHYVLTVYDTDDETPLWEVGTDPTHANPYLHRPEELATQELDLLRGGASIGQVRLRVIDPQTGATQADRWVTERLGIPQGSTGEGHSAANGRRAVLARAGGSTLLDGVITQLRLSDSFAGFGFTLKDIRERPRKIRAFTSAARRDPDTGAIVQAPSVLPRGSFAGYGRFPLAGQIPVAYERWGWLAPPVTPFRATVEEGGANIPGELALSLHDTEWPSDTGSKNWPAKLVVTDLMREVASREDHNSHRDEPEPLPDVVVLWRPDGSTDWSEGGEVQLSRWGLTRSLRTVAYQARNEAGEIETRREDMYVASRLHLDTAGALPTLGATVEFVLLYTGEPTEAYPFTFEGEAGEFLGLLYEGHLSDRDPRYRYDAAAVAALHQKIRILETAPRDDIRGVEEELYHALGYGPAVKDGLLTPVSTDFPDSIAGLPEITDDNAQPIPGWEHSIDDAVTEVAIEYRRDFRIPLEEDPQQELSDGMGLGHREVRHEVPAPDWATDLVGEHPHEIDAWMFRAVGRPGGSAIGEAVDEQGGQLALGRGRRLLDRWLFGGQVSAARVRKADVPGVEMGGWVIDSRSWRPNYQTLTRGGPVIAQVQLLDEVDEGWLNIVLVDAGPADQPLSTPTMGNPTADADGRVTVAMTSVPAGADAELEYAISDTEPAADSGEWTHGARRTGDGDLTTPPLPLGGTAWVRSRAVRAGRIPSPWAAAKSIALTGVPALDDVRLTVGDDDGSALVEWDANRHTAGVRIHYEAHRPSDDPTLPDSVDVDADDGSYTFPAGTVPGGRAFTVEVEPWSAFSAGAVSGDSGDAVRATDLFRDDDPAVEVGGVERFIANLVSSPTYAWRLRARISTATSGLRVTVTPDPNTGTDSMAVDYDVSDFAGRHVTVDLVDTTGLLQHFPRDNAEYVVGVEPYSDYDWGASSPPSDEGVWVGGDVAGDAGDSVELDVTADGGIADPTDDQHPVTKAYADANYGGGGDPHSLDSHTDVSAGAPSTNDLLQYDGTNWVNVSSIGWSLIGGTPTTLAGYGITDAYTDSEVDTLLADKADLAGATFTGAVAFNSGYTTFSSGSTITRLRTNSSNVRMDFITARTNAGDIAFRWDTGTVLNAMTLTEAGSLAVGGKTVWHAGNDGAASGLDADLLDGEDGSYYLSLANATGVLDISKGGTGLDTIAGSSILATNAAGDMAAITAPASGDRVLQSVDGAIAWLELAAGTLAGLSDTSITSPGSGQYLRHDGADWKNAAIKVDDLPIVTVAKGGTGRSSLTAGRILVGAGTSPPDLLDFGAAGGYVRSNGSSWVRGTIQTGDIPDLSGTYAALSGATFTGNVGIDGWDPDPLDDHGTTAGVLRLSEAANLAGFGSNVLRVAANAYRSSTASTTGYRRVTANGATMIQMSDTTLQFRVGSSGTAGGEIDMAVVAEIDSAGMSILGNTVLTTASSISVSQLTGTLPISKGGTSLDTIAGSSILATNAAGDMAAVTAPSTGDRVLQSIDGAIAWLELAAGTLAGLSDTTISSPGSGQFLQHDGSAWVNAAISASDLPIVTVAKGGTGRSSLTTGRILVGAGTSPPDLLDYGAAGGFVRSNGSTWQRGTIQADDVPDLSASKITAGTFGGSGDAILPKHLGLFGYDPSTIGDGHSSLNRGSLVLSDAQYITAFGADVIRIGVNGYRDTSSSTGFRRVNAAAGSMLQLQGETLAFRTFDDGTAGGETTATTQLTANTTGIGIGKAPTAKLDVGGSALIGGGLTVDSDSTFSARVDMADPRVTSARWLKTDIEDLAGSAERILALRPKRYRWKKTGEAAFGFIADEVAAVDPLYGDDRSWSHGPVITDLVGVAQTHEQRIAALEAENEALRGRLELLEAA